MIINKNNMNKKIIKIIFVVLILYLFIFIFIFVKNLQNNSQNNDLDNDLDNKPEIIIPEKLSPSEELLSQMTLEEKVGQMLMFGFSGTEPDYYINEMIAERNIGGIILMGHNIQNREQLKTLIKNLQLKSSSTNLEIPLFIAVDQEGGGVLRVKVDGVSEFTAQSDIKNKEQALMVAINRGRELKDLGINLNFSPVLDYITNEKSFLYSRTFQEDLAKTAEFGSAMVQGYQEYIISSPKHFLGHPDSIIDPHASIVISDFSLEEIIERINIFKKVYTESSPSMIMISHIIYNNIDIENPCSLSKKCINNWLKEEAKFSPSIIITDAMEMGAIQNKYTNSEAAILAIKAGNDILLYTRDFEKQKEAYNSIINAISSGEIDIEQINNSVLKILELKKSYFDF